MGAGAGSAIIGCARITVIALVVVVAGRDAVGNGRVAAGARLRVARVRGARVAVVAVDR